MVALPGGLVAVPEPRDVWRAAGSKEPPRGHPGPRGTCPVGGRPRQQVIRLEATTDPATPPCEVAGASVRGSILCGSPLRAQAVQRVARASGEPSQPSSCDKAPPAAVRCDAGAIGMAPAEFAGMVDYASMVDSAARSCSISVKALPVAAWVASTLAAAASRRTITSQ